MNCGNIHLQAPLPETLQQTLYFRNEMEQSLLIEVELRLIAVTQMLIPTLTPSVVLTATQLMICNTTDT